MKTARKFAFLVMTVVCLLAMLAITGSAEDGQTTIQAGGHELTLSLNESGTWTVVSGSRYTAGGDLVIPSEVDGIAVTAIAENCFTVSQNILNGTLTLPETLEEIGARAFYDCYLLTGDLTIPQSCKTVGDDAFNRAYETGGGTLTIAAENIGSAAFFGTSFTSVCLEEGVKTVSNSAFGSMRKMTGLELRTDTLQHIGDGAFSSCSSLSGTLALPNNLLSIGSSAFSGCSSLTGDLTIPASCQSVGSKAFYNAYKSGGTLTVAAAAIGDEAFYKTGFTGLCLAQGVQTIGSRAFASVSTLISLDIQTTALESIGESSFSSCSNITGPLLLCEGLQSIGTNAFYSCRSLTGDLTIPASCQSVGSKAFYNAYDSGDTLTVAAAAIGEQAFYSTGFANVCLADGVQTVGKSAFESSSMTALDIQTEQLTSIDEKAFSGCSSLTGDLTIPASCQSIGASAFSSTYKTGGALTVAAKSIGSRAFSSTGFTMVHLTEGVQTVGSYAFQSCGMTGLEIASTQLETVENYAFSSCSKLTGPLTIPVGVRSLGDYAFSGCSSLQGSVTCGAASIGKYAFSGIGTNCSLILLDGVREIGAYAFNNSGFSGDLILPNTVTTIGERAFYGCTNLTRELKLSTSLETVGKEAFRNSGLQGTLSFPASLQSIGESAFYNARKLTGIEFAETVAEGCVIEQNAFYDCTALSTSGEDALVLPEGLVSIGNSAFRNLQALTGSLTLPDSLVTVSDYAFYNCKSLSGSLKLPKNLQTLGSSAFQNCQFSGTLDFPKTLTSIGSYAFSGCKFSGTLVLPDGITTLPNYVFYNLFSDAEAQGTLVLPESLTSIGNYAFSGCVGLTGDLIIPDSVKNIGNGAFANCIGFTSLQLPKALESIGDEAFSGCSAMTGNLLFSDTLTTLGQKAFLNCSSLDGLIRLPQSLTQIPDQCFSGCSNLTGGLQIPDSITVIGNNAFLNCSALNGDLILSSQLTSIGSSAFAGCSRLTGKISLSDSLTTLGAGAFQNCSSLTGKLDIPNSLTVLDSNTFQNCSGLTGKLFIPSNITAIGYSTFQGCTGFTGLEFADGITSLYPNAFDGCTGLTGDLIIPDSVTGMGASVFANCTGLDGTLKLSAGLQTVPAAFSGSTNFASLIIPYGVKTIESSAFKNFSSLTGDLIIPDSVTSIGASAFYGCSGLNGKLKLSETLQSIGMRAFLGCSGLTGELELPDSLQTISDYAFQGCKGFTGDLIIPPGITEVGDYAFYNCRFGGTLMLPYSIYILRDYAFSYCTFEKVYFPNVSLYIAVITPFDGTKITEIYYGGHSNDFPFSITGIDEDDVVIYDDSYPSQNLTIKGGSSLSYQAGQTFTLEAFYYNDNVVADPVFTWSSNKPDIILVESSTQKVGTGGYIGTTTATFRALTEGTASITVSGPESMTDSCVVTAVDHAEIVFIPQSGQSAVEPMPMKPGDTMDVLFSYRCYGSAAADLDSIKWETLVDGQVKDDIVSLTIHEPTVESEEIATLTATVNAIGYGGPVEIRVSGPRGSSAHCTVVVPHETLTILYEDKTQPPEPEIIHFRQKIGEPFKFYLRYETALTDQSAVQEEIDNMIWTSATPDFFLDGVHNLDGTTVLKPEVTWTKVRDGVYELEAELEAGIESVTALKIETRNHASDQCIIYATFDVDSYRATLYDRTVNGEKLPEAAMLDTYLYGDTPCQLIVENLHDDLRYLGAVISWEALKAVYTAVDNPSSLANYSVEQSDMYYALLLNILRGTMDAGAGLEATAITSFGSSLASGLQDAAAGFGYNPKDYHATMGWLVANQDAILQNTYVDKLDSLGTGSVGNLLSVGNVVYKSIDDYQTALANRIVLLRTTENMQNMLETMLQKCPDSNDALKDALTKCLEQVKKTNEELAYDAELTLIDSVGKYGYQAAFDFVWDKLMDHVKLTCPQVAILSSGYAIGNIFSNQIYNTDALLERYYMMKAYEEIRQVAQSAKLTLGASWSATPSSTTATQYLCALDVLYRINHLDAELAMDYTQQALDADATFGDYATIVQLKEALESFTTYDTSLTNAYVAFQDMWYTYFKQDYPTSLMDLQYADLFESMTGAKPKRIVVVSCPVNVYVYDSAGNMVAGVVNEKLTCQADDIAVMLSGTQKTLYFYSDTRYTLEYEGYDTGTMSITDRTFDADGNQTRILSYYDLPVAENQSYTASGVDNLRSSTGYVQPDGDSLDHASYTVKIVDGLLQADGPFTVSATAYAGEQLRIMAKIPAGAVFIGWTSDLGTDIFDDPSNLFTTVRMPAGDVVITAAYTFSLDAPPSDRLILADESGKLLSGIPQNSFTVHITAPSDSVHGILAFYSVTGKLVGTQICDLSESNSLVCHFQADNTDGSITQLRFFSLDASYTPVQSSISLPHEVK